MKKITAIILALVLVLSLNVAAMAEGTSGNTTEVRFTLDSSQISVTLPVGGITASAAATVTEQDTVVLTWPTVNAITITNNSAFPIKVDSITCSNLTSGWTLAATDEDADDTIVANVMAGGAGTAVNLLTTLQTCLGTQWNIAAVTAETHSIGLTFAGNIHNPDDMTAAIASDGTKIFDITFTVSAGSHEVG